MGIYRRSGSNSYDYERIQNPMAFCHKGRQVIGRGLNVAGSLTNWEKKNLKWRNLINKLE
jgi:hypothetical protein